MVLYASLSAVIMLLISVSLCRRVPATELPSSEIYMRRRRLGNLGGAALLLMVFLFVLTGWRSINIGNDTKAYAELFERFISGNLTSRVEIGYKIYCWLVGLVTSDPHVFFIITAAVCYFFVWRYIYHHALDIPTTVCLFFAVFFSVFTNTLRQALAMIFVLYAYGAMKQRKNFKAVILIILGATFHISSLLGVVFLLYKVFPKKPRLAGIITTAIFVLSISGLISRVLLMLLPQYAHYFSGKYASSGWLAVGYDAIRSVALYIISYSVLRTKKCLERQDAILLTCLSAMMMCSMFGFVVNLFTRVSSYFFLIAIVEVPNVIQRSKNRKVYTFLLCTVSLAYFLVSLYFRPEWNHLYPYEFWS